MFVLASGEVALLNLTEKWASGRLHYGKHSGSNKGEYQPVFAVIRLREGLNRGLALSLSVNNKAGVRRKR